MSYSNFGQPPQITQAFHTILLQLVDSMTQQVQPFQVKQILMDQLQRNPNLIANFHHYVTAELGRMGASPTSGFHEQDLKRIVYAWCESALVTLRQQLPSQSMPPPGMGMPMGFGGVTMSSGPAPGNIYSTGASSSPPPMPSQPTPQFAPVGPMASPPPPQKDVVKMPDHLTFQREALDDTIQFDHTRGLDIIDSPFVADWDNHRLTFASLKYHLPATSVFEAYRDLDRLLPDSMKRGYWAYRLIYTRLEHLALDTALFLEVREQVRKRYSDTKWRSVLDVLRSVSQGTWATIDAYLTDRLNLALQTLLRSEDRLSVTLSIQSIADLDELCDPHFTSPLADHPEFPTVLTTLIAKVIKETFISETVVMPGSAHCATPLLKCQDVHYFENRISKYDYGMLEQAQRDALLASLFASNTVLQVPRCLVATNVVAPDQIDRLRHPTYLLAADRDCPLLKAVVDQMFHDKKPLPDALVLNKYRVSPKDALAIVTPIYPMGLDTLHLLGNNHQLGW